MDQSTTRGNQTFTRPDIPLLAFLFLGGPGKSSPEHVSHSARPAACVDSVSAETETGGSSSGSNVFGSGTASHPYPASAAGAFSFSFFSRSLAVDCLAS